MANPGFEYAEAFNPNYEAHNPLQNNGLEQVTFRDPDDNIPDTTDETVEATMPSSSHQQPATAISAPEVLVPSETTPPNEAAPVSEKKPIRVHFCIPAIEGVEKEEAKKANMPSSHQKLMAKIFDNLLSDPLKFTQLVNDTIKADLLQKSTPTKENEPRTPAATSEENHVSFCVSLMEGEETENGNKSASPSPKPQQTMDIVFGDLSSEHLASNQPVKDDIVKADTPPKDTPPDEGEPSTVPTPEEKPVHVSFLVSLMEGEEAKKANTSASPSPKPQQNKDIVFGDLVSEPLTSDQPEKDDTVKADVPPKDTPPNEGEPSTAPTPEINQPKKNLLKRSHELIFQSANIFPMEEVQQIKKQNRAELHKEKHVQVSFCMPEIEEDVAKKAGKPASASFHQHSMKIVFSDLESDPLPPSQTERSDTMTDNASPNTTPPSEAETSTDPASEAMPIQVSFCIPLLEGEVKKEAEKAIKPDSTSSYQQTMEIVFSDLNLESQSITQLERNDTAKVNTPLKTTTPPNEANPSTALASKKKPSRVYFCIHSKEKEEGLEAKKAHQPAATSQPSSMKEAMTIFFVNLSSDPLMLSQAKRNKAPRGKIRLKPTPPKVAEPNTT